MAIGLTGRDASMQLLHLPLYNPKPSLDRHLNNRAKGRLGNQVQAATRAGLRNHLAKAARSAQTFPGSSASPRSILLRRARGVKIRQQFIPVFMSRSARVLRYLLRQYACLRASYAAFCKEQEGSRRLRLGKDTRILGAPHLDIDEGAVVILGDRVTLNSRNDDYHVAMWSCVKLVANAPGASITIGDDTRIHGSCLHALDSISIGRRCLIAANCQIIDSNGHPTALDRPEMRICERDCPRPVVIEDDVWIGTGVLVLPGTRIGRGSVVGAGSVVSRDIPPGVVAAGNPARVVLANGEQRTVTAR